MSWLIFGGSGQLGLEIKSVLTTRDFKFLSVDSDVIDITSKEQVFSYIRNTDPCYVINAAAWTNVDSAEIAEQEAYEVNAIGAWNIAKACQMNDSIFMQISTDYVFSGEGSTPWRETSICNPKTAYGRTKFAGELLIKELNYSKSYIFRTAWLYSQFKTNFVKNIIRQSQKNEIIKVVDDQFGQPTSAQDLAKKIIDSMIEKIPFGLYHATNSGEASWFDFASKILEYAKIENVEVQAIRSSELKRKAVRPQYSVLGHGKWSDINFPEMRNWEVALQEVMPNLLETLGNEQAL